MIGGINGSSSNYFEILFELSPEYLFIIDTESSRIMDVNKQACKYYGYSKSEFKKMYVTDIEMNSDTRNQVKKEYPKISRGETIEVEGIHKKKDGGIFPVNLTICKLDDQLELITIRDISEKIMLDDIIANISAAVSHRTGDNFIKEIILQLAKALGSNYTFIALKSKTQPNIINTIAICEENKIVDNISYEYSNTPCEQILSNNCRTYVDNLEKRFSKHLLEDKTKLKAYSGAPLINSKGEVFGLLATLFNKPIDNPSFVESLLQLYAARTAVELERKEAEEELNRSIKNWKDIDYALNQATIVAITDVKGKISYVNDVFCKISQFEASELIGQDHRIINSGHHPKEFWKTLWATISKGQVWHGEVKNKAKDGSFYWVKTTIVPKLNDKGKPIAYTAVRTDITDRKEAELRLQQSSEEKEVMLKEIHHRVKNNLQVIISLLGLQSLSVSDPAIRELFKQSESRIKSMSIVHEMLYQCEDLSKIYYHDYLKDLGNYLIKSASGMMNIVELEIEADEIYLDINTAVPMGLLINEIITNSLKYGFTEGEKGTITLSLKAVEKSLILRIGDNGKGMSESDANKSTKSLGLKLISSLTRQLNGEMEKDYSKKGTHYIFTFKYR